MMSAEIMLTKLFRAVIMGAPASGKGTISSRVIKYFDIQHVSSGDVLRRNILQETEVGLEVKECVAKGHLVPDKLMVKLISTELAKLSNKNWLLDGFPRTLDQAKELHALQPVGVALNLDVPFAVIIKRVAGRWIHESSGRVYNTEYSPPKVWGKDDVTGEDLIQRADDKPEAVQKRLDIYTQTVKPIQEFYQKQGILKTFSGSSSDEIWPSVYDFLAQHIEPKKISQ